jgi:hypothetical protein
LHIVIAQQGCIARVPEIVEGTGRPSPSPRAAPRRRDPTGDDEVVDLDAVGG